MLAGGEVVAKVEDGGNGWYTATYTLTVAGPFTVRLALDQVPAAGEVAVFSGSCSPADCDPEKCTVSGLQLGGMRLLAGRQAKLQLARYDRRASIQCE